MLFLIQFFSLSSIKKNTLWDVFLFSKGIKPSIKNDKIALDKTIFNSGKAVCDL